jgi:hypothetical protein
VGPTITKLVRALGKDGGQRLFSLGDAVSAAGCILTRIIRGFIGGSSWFDRYFFSPLGTGTPPISPSGSRPMLTLHSKERERFLIHLEAGGTGRQAIRTAACDLLQFVLIVALGSSYPDVLRQLVCSAELTETVRIDVRAWT